MATGSREQGVGLRLNERVALERAPRRRGGVNLPDIAGKVWNLPNTAIGLAYGLAGHVAGELNRLLPGDQPDPRIQFGHNAVEFVNNPLGGGSAITLGNTITYRDDPYDQDDPRWKAYRQQFGQDVRDHERQHTEQGQLLGPFYPPSNLLGGGLGLLRDGAWHGPSNWNERGPDETPPRPWSSKTTP